MAKNTRNQTSIISSITRSYSQRYRLVIVCVLIFLIAGSVLLLLYQQNPTGQMSQLFLSIGASLLTGVVFSLVLPIFLTDPDEISNSLTDGAVFDLATNRFLGLGRLWKDEDTFNNEFNMKDFFNKHAWDEATFVGLSLSRFLATFGHALESSYAKATKENWRPCNIIMAAPESEYVTAHIKSNFGRKDTKKDILLSIERVNQIKKSIALAHRCTPEEIPIHLQITHTQIRFGLYHFKNTLSILTIYRFGSRSYYNPRLEFLNHQPSSNQITPLSQWIQDYIDILLQNSETYKIDSD